MIGKLLATIAPIFLIPCHNAPAQMGEVVKYSLPSPPYVTRSDFYSVHTIDSPRAVLVLCPGMNGNGGDWIRQPDWQSFARLHQLGLVGLSFASNPADRDHGYHYVRQGSGQALLNGIRKIYGRDLPLLLFGFSRGAVFACRFADWQPQRLLAWCAYSPGEGDEQSSHRSAPPGLIACGEDDSNYGWALSYFKRGRAQGKPWLWLSLAPILFT
jgi:pimeloyl-ACP methyl ester carboxylesterase